jgi:hypothetical protein
MTASTRHLRDPRTGIVRLDPNGLPPATGHDDVDLALARYRELVTRRQAAAGAVTRAEQARAAAVETDRDALATALRESKRDPGAGATESADVELAEARRILAGYDQAVAEEIEALVAIVHQHRPELVARNEAELEEAKRDADAALVELEVTLTRLAGARAALEWAEAFGEEPTRFRVRGLAAGDGTSAMRLLDGLRTAVRPPAPRAPVRPRMARRTADGSLVYAGGDLPADE